MQTQLAFDLFAPAPDECECLTYSHRSGRPRAQIITKPAPGGFIYGISACLSLAAFSGMPAEPDVFSSRSEAIARAGAEIIRRIDGPAPSGSRSEIDQVVNWVRQMLGRAS